MEASKTRLPWINYELVDEGKDKRNQVAHEAKHISIEECIKYINAIEEELKNWNILSKS